MENEGIKYARGWRNLINLVISDKNNFTYSFYEDGIVYILNKNYDENSHELSSLKIYFSDSNDNSQLVTIKVVDDKELDKVNMDNNVMTSYELKDNYYLEVSGFDENYRFKLRSLSKNSFNTEEFVDFVVYNRILLGEKQLTCLSNKLCKKIDEHTDDSKIFECDYELIELINLLLNDNNDLNIEGSLNDELYSITKRGYSEEGIFNPFILVKNNKCNNSLLMSISENGLVVKMTNSDSDLSDYKAVTMTFNKRMKRMNHNIFKKNMNVLFESNESYEDFCYRFSISNVSDNNEIKKYRIKNIVSDMVDGKSVKENDEYLDNIVIKHKTSGLDEKVIKQEHGLLSKNLFIPFEQYELSFVIEEIKKAIKNMGKDTDIKINTKK